MYVGYIGVLQRPFPTEFGALYSEQTFSTREHSLGMVKMLKALCASRHCLECRVLRCSKERVDLAPETLLLLLASAK